jgi:Flp pilus assembly pilin Flp
MKNQIEKFRGQGMSTDTQRKKTLRDLDEKLKRTEIKADEYEERYQQAVRTITQLKNGIHSIFTRIGAASANVDETLGNQGVTESNMMQYLGIIEQRTTEILQAFANSQSGATESAMQFTTIDATDGANKTGPQPPSFDEISSGEESEGGEDERPLTRQELEKKTMRELTKKVVTN